MCKNLDTRIPTNMFHIKFVDTLQFFNNANFHKPVSSSDSHYTERYKKLYSTERH